MLLVMSGGGWKTAAKHFGESVKTLCEMLDGLESDINVEDYPRVMYEVGREKETKPQQQQEEDYQEGGGQLHARGDWHRMVMEAEQREQVKTDQRKGEKRGQGEGGRPDQARGEANPSTRDGRHAERTRPGTTTEAGEKMTDSTRRHREGEERTHMHQNMGNGT
jgi:hypothetical protein